jgi:hypothetical protein
MSGKVLATIGQVLTVDVIDAMAGRAEMDRASARKAAELGAPAILTALTELVARSSGLARLTRALAGQSTNPGPVEDGRGDGIGVLLGGENAGALASAIGRFVGAPKRSAYAFLDELTATILQALAREGANAHAGGEGVANLLMAEKDLIAAAMPAGLSSLLGAKPGSRGTARGEIDRPSRGGATAPPLMRPLKAGPALGAVSLVALAALAWYVLAAKIEQIGGGSGDRVVASLPEPNVSPQVQADVARLDASAPQRGAGINDLGGGMMGAAEVLGGPDGIRSALVRLEYFFGFGEHGIAGSVVRLLHRQHDNGPDRRLILDAEKADLLAARRQLRFVSPQFKHAIHQPVATAVDKPAGPTIAAH